MTHVKTSFFSSHGKKLLLLPVLLVPLYFTSLTTSTTQASPSALTGYSSNKKLDLAGYYLPTKPLQAGNFKLSFLFLGAGFEFEKFESGKNDVKNYAPFMVEFDDVTSEAGTEGQTYFPVDLRVLPSAYRINDKTVEFVGQDKAAGEVIFKGKLDKKALASAVKLEPEAHKKVVLRGDLTFGGQTFKDVTFTWFAGD